MTKDTDMQRALDHANEAWREAAWAALLRVATQQPTLTSSDVWDAIQPGVATHEPRAMGPIIAAAAARGILVATNTWVQTPRPSANLRPIMVWRSAIYGIL